MEVLWLSIVLYSLGLGLVLHFRPALMFHENGSWKEFGYQRSPESRFTVFPFWLFAITWAFLSYALASTASWIYPTIGLSAATIGTTELLKASSLPSDPHSFGSYEEVEESEGEDTEEEEDKDKGKDKDKDTEKDKEQSQEVMEIKAKRPRGRPRKEEVKPGYYVLDPSVTSGLRKYIYYGSSPPAN